MFKCQHERFESRVSITRLTSHECSQVTGYTADIVIRCSECGVPFQFLGLHAGASLSNPMVSIDGLEARMPIVPAGIVPSQLHRIAGSRENFDA